jgi:hypothetical protein
MELKSLTQWSECAGAESGCLRILRECLDDSFVRLGDYFIVPRQLGVVGDTLGSQTCLLLGAPPDSHCSCPVCDLLPFLAHPTVGPRGQLVHQTLSGAHRTVRCAQPTVALAIVGSPDSPVHHRTVRWIIAVRRRRIPRAASSPRTSLAHRTVRCAKPSWSLLHIANCFPILFSLFIALRQNTLVLKTMY